MASLRNIIEDLERRMTLIYEHSEPLIPVIGLFTIIWHIACFFIWGNLLPQLYESLPLRLFQAGLALPLMFHSRFKHTLAKFYPPYYLFLLSLASPYFFFFMTLKNECSTVWVMSTLTGCLVLIPFIYDWLFICILMPMAFLLAQYSVVLLDGGIRYTHMVPDYIPIYLFGITGSLVGARWTHSRHETRVTLMKSLSGTIAHEMRSPLNAITLAIDSIKSMLPKRLAHGGTGTSVTIPEAVLNSIHGIIDQGGKTIRQSNKIIDSILASLNGNAIDRRQFSNHSAGTVIKTVIGTYGFESPGDRRLVNVDITRDFEFFGDRDLLSHTLFNLLNNALYYRAKPGFRIDIFTQTGTYGSRIIFRDTGPGVAPDKREAIFGQFFTAGKSGGNGLGLSFCRRVVESFGGSIICRSSFGEWTEFVIDLPACDSITVGEIKRELLAEKRVLVVDDQASNRITLGKYLADMNFRIDQAENGKISLEMAAKNRYDLILMDVEMPVLNGDDAARRLRAGSDLEPSLALHYRDIPIIGITGLPENEAKRRTIQSGMDRYALKPIGRAKLGALIDNIFFSEKPEKQDKPLSGVTGTSILLVDDNIMARELLKALLEPLGYRIFQAENGMMAIDLLRELPIDLIIMDLEMPVMGGIDTARAIRNDNASARSDQFREVPIISLSGYTDEQTIAQVRESGINLHLGKPTPKHQLINAISTLLTRAARPAEDPPAESASTDLRLHELETVPLLDQAILDGLEGLGDEEFLGQLFNLFVQDAGKIIEELEEACRRNDHEQVRRSSHTLKGSAASIGAARLKVIATIVNGGFHEQRCPDGGDWIEDLRNVYELTARALFDYADAETRTRNE